MLIKKIQLGIILGAIAGVVDVIPMILQNLTWDANISAFIFWIIAGFFIATTNIKLKKTIKGALISMILLVPLGIIIGWKEPAILIPIIAINLILGSALGFFIDKYGN